MKLPELQTLSGMLAIALGKLFVYLQTGSFSLGIGEAMFGIIQISDMKVIKLVINVHLLQCPYVFLGGPDFDT